MSWQIIVDFDGTITKKDTTDMLLERFALPEWRAIEDDWVTGKIGSRECMQRQIDLIRATPADLDDFIASIEPDWNFKSFVRLAQRHNIPVKIVSDGLDFTIRAVMRRLGLDNMKIVANHLSYKGGDRWALSSPHAVSNCAAGTCKCAVAAQRAPMLTLLVGDGRSDMCVAGEADLTFAKSSLLGFCREHSLPHHAFGTFADATALLAQILETPAVPAILAAQSSVLR